MSDNGQDRFEIPKEMRSMAEASFDQARQAFVKIHRRRASNRRLDRGAQRDGSRRRQDVGAKAISYRKERAGFAGLRAVAAACQGFDRNHAAAR